jgi:hypothetical protein
VALLAGFTDDDLHPQVVEALKVLRARKDEYARALASIEGQYLRPLEGAHDGKNDACTGMRAQLKAVRKLF